MKNRIKFYLGLFGMNATDLSEKTGLCEATISKASHRNKATTRTRKKIAEVFGLTESDIFPNAGAEEN